jgi:NADH-quinone oxidoreductase subunit M
MGVYPESFMAPMRDDVGRLLTRIERAAPNSDSAPTAGKPAAKADAHGAAEPHSTPAEAH